MANNGAVNVVNFVAVRSVGKMVTGISLHVVFFTLPFSLFPSGVAVPGLMHDCDGAACVVAVRCFMAAHREVPVVTSWRGIF